MDVCYNADSNYLKPLLISIFSLCKYNRGVRIHIISYGGIEISDFKFIIKRFEVSINIYHANDEMLAMKGFGRFPPVVFGRLYIPQIIEAEKVIYLDVDTIITSKLDSLWNEECSVLCAVQEKSSNIVNNLKCKYDMDNYFNAGVLLINTKNSEKYFQQAVEIAQERELPYLDQDAINIAFNGLIRSIKEQYNHMSIFETPDKPIIIHFAHLKPWKRFCLHAYKNEYKKIECEIENHFYKECNLSKTNIKDIVKNIYMRLM